MRPADTDAYATWMSQLRKLSRLVSHLTRLTQVPNRQAIASSILMPTCTPPMLERSARGGRPRGAVPHGIPTASSENHRSIPGRALRPPAVAS
jgi:hypothetical protein